MIIASLAPDGVCETEVSSRVRPEKVVARYADGRVLRGYLRDFDERRADFHMEPEGGGEQRRVAFRDLKALFFVRELRGDPQHRESTQVAPSARQSGHPIEITFPDGETMRGYTDTVYPWEGGGFFITPIDPSSNNVKVLVITSA